jgi:hypothetical protein
MGGRREPVLEPHRASGGSRPTKHSIAVERPESVVQPRPIPPLPAEAFSFPSLRQLAPDFLLHPIFDVAEALTGVSNREVVHPAPEHRIDQAYYPANRLRPVSAKHLFEPAQKRRSLFELGRVMRPHRSAQTAEIAEVEKYLSASCLGTGAAYVKRLARRIELRTLRKSWCEMSIYSQEISMKALLFVAVIAVVDAASAAAAELPTYQPKKIRGWQAVLPGSE